MFRPFKTLSAVILTAAVTITPVGIAFAEAPEHTLTESDAFGAYSTTAKRITYSGALAEFSVDIPDGLSPAPSDGEAKEVGDGSTQWELFYGEDSTLYIDCCFHRNEGGYAGEMSSWWQSLEDGLLDMDIFYGSDLDGTEYSVVDLRYVYSEDDGTEILIGEYPWDEDTWINISVGGSTADMSGLREDICVMLGTFSRNMQSDTTAEEQYLTIDRDWIQLSILDKPFGEEYEFRQEWEEEDRRYIGYATRYEDHTADVDVIIQCALGSENEVEDNLRRSQEPKSVGCLVFDYLGILQAKSGQDIYVFSYYTYGTEDNEIGYEATSYGANGHNVYINVNLDSEHNTDENRERTFELFRSLSWSEPLDDLPEGTAEQDEQSAPADETTPETGAAAPVTAALAAVGAAIVMTVSGRKFKRK